MSRIEILADPTEAATVASTLGQLVARSNDGTYAIARRNGLIAVPGESSCHFNAADQERIAKSYINLGVRTLWAIRLEEFAQEPLVYRVDATTAGLGEFNEACSHFNYCLCDATISSAVICTTDDYLVFIGTPEFVRDATGMSVAAAAVDFRGFIRRAVEVWPDTIYLFDGVYRALLEDYPAAKVGQWVAVPRKAE